MKSDHKLFAKALILIVLLFTLADLSTAQSSRVRQTSATENKADKPLKILSQPAPLLTADQKEQIKEIKKETVKVEVEFLDIGLIGAVNPVDAALPEPLRAVFVKAAEEIKFEPELKNGKPVSIIKIIEYSLKPKKLPPVKVSPESARKAKAVISRAVTKLGGAAYLGITTQIGRGTFTTLKGGRNASFQTFVDVIVYPDRERTDFKTGGIKTIQTNYGDRGWIFDEAVETLEDQTEAQIENFKRAMRINPDNFLRGVWADEAVVGYVGRRSAGVGRRNDVLRLTFADGFAVEFEFSDAGLPVKTVYRRTDARGREIKEVNRYAQFIDIQGIQTPFIIDHFTDGVQTSRINYESVEYNRPVPDSIFAKPADLKAARKKLKL